MENKRKYKISWTDIYSLGLLPAILIWGLSPLFSERAISITSIAVGFVEIVFSYFYTSRDKGCGIIGWITGWGLLLGGLVQILLSLIASLGIPSFFFVAPCIAILGYQFDKFNITPKFCYKCAEQQNCEQRFHTSKKLRCYETHYIIQLIWIGAIISTVLSWGLFLYGFEIDSRAGTYFYFYFPTGLGIAVILFETIRRQLIQYLFDGYSKKNRPFPIYTNDNLSHPIFSYTKINIMIIGDEKIFLIEDNNDRDLSELKLPIYASTTFCMTQKEETQKARQIVWEKLGIENPDLRHIYSTIAQDPLRQIGGYILFLPPESLSKLDQYPGRWYTVNEIATLFHSNRLSESFKEIYARFYTIVNTARTYHSNGKRRYAIRGYKPAFSLHHIDQLDIVFDDPLWLYVSHHNEDHLIYRIDTWLRKLFQRNDSSKNYDA